MGSVSYLPTGTVSRGPGLRSASEREVIAHKQHLTQIEELGGDLMDLAVRLLDESKSDACTHTKRLVDLSESVSRVGADVQRYFDDNEEMGDVSTR